MRSFRFVDDDDALRSSLKNLIRSIGLRAQGFSSAEAFLRSNQVRETGCLILDLRMPGMSGLELQGQMALANSHLPIIFITAHKDAARRTQALEAGPVAFLYKPYRFSHRRRLEAYATLLSGVSSDVSRASCRYLHEPTTTTRRRSVA
jgi:FixJ family two-component response regulator